MMVVMTPKIPKDAEALKIAIAPIVRNMVRNKFIGED